MGCHREAARRRRQGLRDALRRAGELAVAERCDAVTIGGDLYEHERSGFETGRWLAELFGSWRPLRVFMAPDGRLAASPVLIEASASAKGPALMQSAINALQACQPHVEYLHGACSQGAGLGGGGLG